MVIRASRSCLLNPSSAFTFSSKGKLTDSSSPVECGRTSSAREESRASASLASVVKVGSTFPFSIREYCPWGISTETATCCWEKPLSLRRRWRFSAIPLDKTGRRLLFLYLCPKVSYNLWKVFIHYRYFAL